MTLVLREGGGPENQREVWESQARMVVCAGRWVCVHLCGDGSGKENVLLHKASYQKISPSLKLLATC